MLLPNTPTKKGAESLYTLADHGFKFHENGNARSVIVDLINENRSDSGVLLAGLKIAGLEIDDSATFKTADNDSSQYISRFELSLTNFAALLKAFKTNRFAVGAQGTAGQCGQYVGADTKERFIFEVPNPAKTQITDYQLAWYKHSEKDSNDASVLFLWNGKFNVNTLVQYLSAKACRSIRDGELNDHIQHVGIDVNKLIQTEVNGELRFSSGGKNLEYVASVIAPKIQLLSAQFDAGSAKVAPLAPTQVAQQFVTPVMDMSQDF